MISENVIFWCSVIYIASTRICTIYLEYLNREWLSDNTVHIFQVLHLRAWLECQKKTKTSNSMQKSQTWKCQVNLKHFTLHFHHYIVALYCEGEVCKCLSRYLLNTLTPFWTLGLCWYETSIGNVYQSKTTSFIHQKREPASSQQCSVHLYTSNFTVHFWWTPIREGW